MFLGYFCVTFIKEWSQQESPPAGNRNRRTGLAKRVPHPDLAGRVPHHGVPPSRTWIPPRRDLGPVNGVPPGKDMEPVEVL